MSPKSFSISSTALNSDKNWVTTDVQPRSAKANTATTVDMDALSVAARIAQGAAGGIVAMVEPTAIARRIAIRKLNDEIEGRLSPSDTFASKTAG
jgi:hypothetical protein